MTRFSPLLPAGLSLFFTALSLPAAVLVNDDFTSATRVGTAPSVTGVDRDGGTSNDYIVATNGSVAMATGATNDRASFVTTGINGNSFAILNEANAYSVTTHFTTTTLAPGESLSLSFNWRTTIANPITATGVFRTGFFNTNGTKIPNNMNAFGGNGAFANDTGYIANYSSTATGFSGAVQERANGTSAQSVFAGTLATLGSSDSSTDFIAFDTTYATTLTLTLSLDGNSMSVDSTFNGMSLGRTDTTTPYTTFDSIGIFLSSQFGNTTTPRTNYIDDVMVVYTPVPEPSAAWLAAALALPALRRRRSA